MNILNFITPTRKSKCFFLIILAFTVSCKKRTISDDATLPGTWNVTKVQGQLYTSGVPGITVTDNAPTGYVRFDSDGRGEQNYSFTLYSTVYPFNDSFYWTSTDTEIRIDRFVNPDMIWARNINEPLKQVVTYNYILSASETVIYTLTLEK